jgi:hypothetical protein
MKKIVAFCLLAAAALVSGTVVYATKSGEMKNFQHQLQKDDVVKCDQPIELMPSLFFF